MYRVIERILATASSVTRLAAFAMFIAVLSIGACGSKQVLIAKPAAVPAGVDLSGQWLLRDTSGTTQPNARETLVHVFLETGSSVKITQTESGLFVSFDRSVVEEYRFGENRNISVGEITADRVSGWEGRSYVIETLDKNDVKLTDRYQLENGGRRLTRSMSIATQNKQLLSLQQVFDRI